MKGKNGRFVRIVNRTAFCGFGRWAVEHYLNDSLITETVRRTRKDARLVARRYIVTGQIPL